MPATRRCAPPRSTSSRTEQLLEELADRASAVSIVRIPGEIQEQRAAQGLRGNLEALDGDCGGNELLAAHADERPHPVPAARLQVAQQVEHARVVEMHADHDQVELRALDRAL